MAIIPGAHTVERLMTLPPKLRTSRVCYSITWELDGDIIRARSMDGMHSFLQESKHYTFDIGEDYVGQLVKLGPGAAPQVLSDIGRVDPRAFTRKRFAIVSGIESIAFVPQPDGSVLELGFACLEDANLTLSALLRFYEGDRMPLSLDDGEFTGTGSLCGAEDSVMPSTGLPSVPESLATAVAEEPSIKQPSANAFGATCFYDAHSGFEFRGVPYPVFQPMGAGVSWPVVPPTFCPWAAAANFPESVSRGSDGHPYRCGGGCKYFWKPKGCKDGEECTRCHICTYSRWQERHPAAMRSRQRKRF